MNKKVSMILGIHCVAALSAGCASQSQPLTYLSLERPKGRVEITPHKSVSLSFPRGGFYFFNYNYRPAADIESYIGKAQREANVVTLENADIKLGVPFAIDILMFGYNHGTDTLTASGDAVHAALTNIDRPVAATGASSRHPKPTSSTLPQATRETAAKPPGVMAYEAEAAAMRSGCVGEGGGRPVSNLLAMAPDRERYQLSCTQGTLYVQCELGRCVKE